MPNAALSVLKEAVRLKRLTRAGWVRKGVPNPETVAAHSWGVAWLATALLPKELSLERALVYATLHDLAEVRVGDITPHDGVSASEKAQREHSAIQGLLGPLERGDALLTLWEQYEAQADPEAQFVRQLDRLDMAIQAAVYSNEGTGGLEEFLLSAAKVITHPRLLPLLEAIRAEFGQER